MKNVKQKRAEELMKRLFEKQGIGEINLAVKETEVVKTEEEVEAIPEQDVLPPEVRSSEDMSEEVRAALGSVLGEEAAERVMAKIEEDINEVATALAEERDAKMEEIKKSKIAATQEEINNLKAKLESIKNDEAEVVEETEDASEDK